MVEHSLGKGEVTSSILVIGSIDLSAGVEVQDSWHILRWAYVAILSVYLVVQVLALRRLRGDQKRRSNVVLTVMLVLMFGSDAIRDIFFFEDRMAHQVGMLVVAGGAIVATLVLGRLFGNDSVEPDGESKSNTEHIQPLKLS